jgi:hypothetical protein
MKLPLMDHSAVSLACLLGLLNVAGCGGPESRCRDNARCICLVCETPSTTSSVPIVPYEVDVEALVKQSTGTWTIGLDGESMSASFDMTVTNPNGDASGPFGPEGIVYSTRNADPCNDATSDSCIDVAIPVGVTLEPVVGFPVDSLRPLHYDALTFTGASEEAAEISLSLALNGQSFTCDVRLRGDGAAAGACTGSETLTVTGARK